ncbi:MAG: hypothetical protein A2V88_08530 [Elusimicrobia bacterium RBG_16_66_12]|nr:MAG: hypothetical protein A2V88_08530 [Elusimicrobia bacterium RBG_16_66_12]
MAHKRHPGIVESALDLIGDTPLLRLKRLTQGLEGEVLIKLEHLNPSGSLKDRMTLRMVDEAESAGTIKPGATTLIESSSGNTAQALAFVGALKGYTVRLRLPETSAVPEKLKALERYGAEVEWMKAGEGDVEADRVAKEAGLHGATIEIPGRLACLQEERDNPDVHWVRQFSNPANVAGQEAIGREILEQTDGKVDVFVASVGTGGTFLGVSRVLRAALPHVRCVAIQPAGWVGTRDPLSPDAKYVPGITGGILKEIRDSRIADEIRTLGNEEARAMAYRLSREEGLNCGISTGANVHVALEEAARPGMAGKSVVTVLVDSGFRYIHDERFIT